MYTLKSGVFYAPPLSAEILRLSGAYPIGINMVLYNAIVRRLVREKCITEHLTEATKHHKCGATTKYTHTTHSRYIPGDQSTWVSA